MPLSQSILPESNTSIQSDIEGSVPCAALSVTVRDKLELSACPDGSIDVALNFQPLKLRYGKVVQLLQLQSLGKHSQGNLNAVHLALACSFKSHAIVPAHCKPCWVQGKMGTNFGFE